jgi:hypothetical protein
MTPITRSPRDPLELVLHIGTGKTGTSSIQAFLHRRRPKLERLGVLYPDSPGIGRHRWLGLYLQSDDEIARQLAVRRYDATEPAEFRRLFDQRLGAEIARARPARVVLSDELLYGSPRAVMERLGSFADRYGSRLRIVVYLRRQDDHLASRYQQVVKTGEVRRLAERVRAVGVGGTYDYHARLARWREVVAPDLLVVRRFERSAFVAGSLYQDFLDAAGIEARAEDLGVPRIRNASLDAESVELLRIVNLLRLEDPEAATGLPGNLVLERELSASGHGPTLTLPEAELDTFMARWAESNRRVAQEFFGADELFTAPRKTEGTTAVQRLDPDRLDHYLTLLRLPEAAQRPLRRLVEREAGSGASAGSGPAGSF